MRNFTTVTLVLASRLFLLVSRVPELPCVSCCAQQLQCSQSSLACALVTTVRGCREPVQPGYCFVCSPALPDEQQSSTICVQDQVPAIAITIMQLLLHADTKVYKQHPLSKDWAATQPHRPHSDLLVAV